MSVIGLPPSPPPESAAAAGAGPRGRGHLLGSAAVRLVDIGPGTPADRPKRYVSNLNSSCVALPGQRAMSSLSTRADSSPFPFPLTGPSISAQIAIASKLQTPHRLLPLLADSSVRARNRCRRQDAARHQCRLLDARERPEPRETGAKTETRLERLRERDQSRRQRQDASERPARRRRRQ